MALVADGGWEEGTRSLELVSALWSGRGSVKRRRCVRNPMAVCSDGGALEWFLCVGPHLSRPESGSPSALRSERVTRPDAGGAT